MSNETSDGGEYDSPAITTDSEGRPRFRMEVLGKGNGGDRSSE